MSAQPRCIVLRNGVHLPRVGLGTFRSKGTDVKQAVNAAVNAGILHIDTASIYKNEAEIADAIASSKINRADVFITSKISPYEQGTDKAEAACAAILQRLQTTCVDLMLLHWPGVAREDATSPVNAVKRLESWRVLERLYDSGQCRAIGVSNFEEGHLRHLLQHARVPPMVNQVEAHPRRPCTQLKAACEREGIVMVAYASLGCGDLLQSQVVMDVAAELGRSPAQVLLRWALDKGWAVIPKTVRPERLQEYTEACLLTWTLGQEATACLDALEDGHKYCWDPSGIA